MSVSLVKPAALLRTLPCDMERCSIPAVFTVVASFTSSKCERAILAVDNVCLVHCFEAVAFLAQSDTVHATVMAALLVHG